MNGLGGRTVHPQFSRCKRVIHARNGSVIKSIPRASRGRGGRGTTNGLVYAKTVATGNAEEASDFARRHGEPGEEGRMGRMGK
jgi:hypothetical protein